MPFTFSHPAIVLPLTILPQKYYSLTGLIIGSLTPDFEYFIRMSIKSKYFHTISGIFWFDLPLGIALSFVFHLIVRNTLFDNLPRHFQARLRVFHSFQWTTYFLKHWAIVCLSLLLGAASHLFWDSFTHTDGYFVVRIPAMNFTYNMFNETVPLFKILQHCSTLVGGLVLCCAFYTLPSANGPFSKVDKNYWFLFIGLLITVLGLRLLLGSSSLKTGHLVASIISAGLLSLILTPLVLKTLKKQASTT